MGRGYASSSVRKRQTTQAALAQLDEKGVSGFTVRAIAARIDIADGSIFRHFKTKKEIVLAAIDVVEARLFDDQDEATDPLERLERFFRHRAQLLGGRDTSGRLIFSDQLVTAVGDEGRKRVLSWAIRSKEFMKSCLEQLEAEGRLRGGIPHDEYVFLLRGRLLAFSRERTLSNRPLTNLQDSISQAWTALRRLIIVDDAGK